MIETPKSGKMDERTLAGIACLGRVCSEGAVCKKNLGKCACVRALSLFEFVLPPWGQMPLTEETTHKAKQKDTSKTKTKKRLSLLFSSFCSLGLFFSLHMQAGQSRGLHSKARSTLSSCVPRVNSVDWFSPYTVLSTASRGGLGSYCFLSKSPTLRRSPPLLSSIYSRIHHVTHARSLLFPFGDSCSLKLHLYISPYTR